MLLNGCVQLTTALNATILLQMASSKYNQIELDMQLVPNTPQISTLRLSLMRGLYLLTFVGLSHEAWSTLLFPAEQLDTLTGVTYSFWASYATLMVIGVRYPIKMLPLILLQLFYKSAWLAGVYWPAYKANATDEDLESFFWVCVTAIILDIFIIPWRYFYFAYIKEFLKFK